MSSEEKRIGRGRGRGLNKGWLGNFKPKPVPITVEQIRKFHHHGCCSLHSWLYSKAFIK